MSLQSYFFLSNCKLFIAIIHTGEAYRTRFSLLQQFEMYQKNLRVFLSSWLRVENKHEIQLILSMIWLRRGRIFIALFTFFNIRPHPGSHNGAAINISIHIWIFQIQHWIFFAINFVHPISRDKKQPSFEPFLQGRKAQSYTEKVLCLTVSHLTSHTSHPPLRGGLGGLHLRNLRLQRLVLVDKVLNLSEDGLGVVVV